MSLNFKDCHAKIRQVDSQATIDNAVVVQVGSALTLLIQLKSMN
jgi:Ras GTPase-activating protein-binding protein 1